MCEQDNRIRSSGPSQSPEGHTQERLSHKSPGTSAAFSQAPSPASHGGVQITSTELPFADLIPAFLNHIRALDRLADEDRSENSDIRKKAIADGTYHVSPAEVAGKMAYQIPEPCRHCRKHVSE
jgi:Anti-sigma-28 factor, FlgM